MSVKVADIFFSYRDIKILQGIDLEVQAGEICTIVGPNGCGKTTLLKNISGILCPQAGVVYLNLQNIADMKPHEISRYLAAVEQHIPLGFDFTVREIVALGRRPYLKPLQGFSANDQRVVSQALELTGTSHFVDRYIFSLSSGERQRVWLAMALAQEPKVLLLDEPTSHLDVNYQIEILEILDHLSSQGMSILLSIHDLNLAALYAHRVVLMHRGQIVKIGSAEETLTTELIEKIFATQIQIVKRPQGGFIIAVTRPQNKRK